MRRRGLFGLALLLAGCLAMTLLLPVPEAIAQDLVLKSGHIANPLGNRHKAALKFAELVNQKSKGKVKVDVYPAEQLGKATAQFQALSMGTQDLCYESLAWYSQFDKDFGYYNVPFVFNTYQEIFKAYESEAGRAMFDGVIKKVGVRCLAYNFEDSLRSLYSVKKPIRTPDDLKGVKMRVPGIKIYIEAWQMLGANTVRVSWGELYTALLQGIVEASEGPLTETYRSKLLKIEKYITQLDYKPSPLTVSISEKTWQKLSPDIQKILSESAHEAGDYFTALTKEEVKETIAKLKEEGNVFVDFDRESFVKKAAGLPQKFEDEGLWTKGLHEKMMQALGRK